MNKIIFIDPSYTIGYQNRIFDNSARVRDEVNLPYIRLQERAKKNACDLLTFDYYADYKTRSDSFDYCSFGLLNNYENLIDNEQIYLKSFYVLEPPVVMPELYQRLPELTKFFERVYVYNLDGEGYSLKNVDQTKLRKLYFPQTHCNVIEECCENRDRRKKMVVINGNHCPKSRENEFYSRRIYVMSALSKLEAVDLYGVGWDRWWSRNSWWFPYYRNYKTLMSIYKGPCKSKYTLLSQYDFSLCFENMSMDGYVTEKMFDCLYAGTIPIYLGQKIMAREFSTDFYIDYRQFSSVKELWDCVNAMSPDAIARMREAGRDFIRSNAFLKYYNFFEDSFNFTE